MTAVGDGIAAELLALRDKSGLIDPKRAVQWARDNPESMLHSAIEWRNREAAEQWRIHQVRRLVAVHLTDEQGHRTVVSLSIDRRVGGGYRAIDDVAKVEDLRAVMLADALAELRRIQARYQHVTELVGIWSQVEEVERKAPRKRGRRKSA